MNKSYKAEMGKMFFIELVKQMREDEATDKKESEDIRASNIPVFAKESLLLAINKRRQERSQKMREVLQILGVDEVESLKRFLDEKRRERECEKNKIRPFRNKTLARPVVYA